MDVVDDNVLFVRPDMFSSLSVSDETRQPNSRRMFSGRSSSGHCLMEAIILAASSHEVSSGRRCGRGD